jgi:hypothetical protein
MKTIEKIKANHWAISLSLLMILFLRQCGINNSISKIEKQSKVQSLYMDSICTKAELKRSIEIEGLKAEKRMIQSTDRRIMDVNRQSEIDAEIKKLETSK